MKLSLFPNTKEGRAAYRTWLTQRIKAHNNQIILSMEEIKAGKPNNWNESVSGTWENHIDWLNGGIKYHNRMVKKYSRKLEEVR